MPGSRFCRKNKVRVAVNSGEKKINRKATASFSDECDESPKFL